MKTWLLIAAAAAGVLWFARRGAPAQPAPTRLDPARPSRPPRGSVPISGQPRELGDIRTAPPPQAPELEPFGDDDPYAALDPDSPPEPPTAASSPSPYPTNASGGSGSGLVVGPDPETTLSTRPRSLSTLTYSTTRYV